MRNFMELVDDDDDDWDDEPPYPDDRTGDGRLRHLVFLDGVLVDTFVRSVRGSEYACIALEMDAQRRPREPEPPPPPPWERDLQRLEGLVGGRAALLTLTSDPLEPRALPAQCVETAGCLDALDLGEEFTTAVRNALVHAHECCPRLLSGPPEQVAAAVTWIVAKANDLTGAKHRLRQADLSRSFGLKTFPSTLASQLARELQRYLPEHAHPYWGSYARQELGLPDALVTSKRQQIVHDRDRALAARERARVDEEARGAGPDLQSR